MKPFTLLFIYPDLGWNSVNFSPAIMSLSGYIKSKLPVRVELLHLNETNGIPYCIPDICERVQNIRPDLIGFTCTSYNYHYVDELSKALKERGNKAPIVCGGSHATIVSDDIRTTSADAFCIGEGEIALSELIQKMIAGEEYTQTNGFWFRQYDAPNPPSKAITHLDEIPFRDYALMNAQDILHSRGGWLNIAFSRGCPYECSFCVNQTLKKVFRRCPGDTRYFRIMSVERVISELLALIEQYENQIKIINFDDDLLLLRKDWFLDFSRQYYEKIYLPHHIKYVINARANLITEDVVLALRKSGAHEVQIGFETGDESLRNAVLRKQITDAQLKAVFSSCRKFGVRTLAYTMLGIPGENKKSVRKTIRMLVELKPTLIRMTIFDPFFGTPLFDYCEQNRLFIDDKVFTGNHFTQSRLRFDDLTEEDIRDTELLFPWLLNEELGLPQYTELLAKFWGRRSERSSVQVLDCEISKEMEEQRIPHFRYFPGNPYYFEYCECSNP